MISPTAILKRLRRLIPSSWFPQDAENVDGTLLGPGYNFSFMTETIDFVRLQTRIKTSTGIWLDLTAYDFFGRRIRRFTNEPDDVFAARIIAEVLRERNTRYAVEKVIEDLVGTTPDIFEPARPADTGAYSPWPAGDGIGRGLAYNIAGGYGSLLLPAQSFVTVHRGQTSGIPGVAGYDAPIGGYSVASAIQYGSMTMVTGDVTDADIYAAIDSVMAAGAIAWVQIESTEPDYTTMFVGGKIMMMAGKIATIG